MQVEAERQACCDGKCVSEACKEICYNDIIHPPDAFATCEGLDSVALHDCCEEWAAGDPYKKFDCTSELTKGDCKTEEECEQNYTESLQEYEEELEVRANQNGDDDKEIYEEIWFIIVVFVVAPLVLIGGIVVGIWAKKTSCGKKPCRQN